MKTKVLPPAYHYIQDFLTKVCMSFFLFYPFIVWNSTPIFVLIFFMSFCFSSWSGPFLYDCQAKGTHAH